MKVEYVKEVVTPADKAGKVGEVKEMDKETAEWLIANGYVESADGNESSAVGPTIQFANDNTNKQGEE